MNAASSISQWRSTLIPPDTPLLKTIEIISKSSLEVALVVDMDDVLLGTVTDGDIRRALLRGALMSTLVKDIMHRDCTTVSINDSRASIVGLMAGKGLRHIPVIDEKRRVVDLRTLLEMVTPVRLDNWVLIMAGGLGSRLRPLTDEAPKPLLKVGNKPLLEVIINQLKEYGLYRFFISINYKAEMIEEYFSDGSKFDVEITYIREKQQLGTAGALGLLPERPTKPILVMNGDLLTQVNVEHLFNFHQQDGSSATMCVRRYGLQLQYGVVKIENNRLLELEEKPVHNFFVNAGIYVLNPEVIELASSNYQVDMTVFFDQLLKLKKTVAVFPIHEYWLDIGRIEDYHQANTDYNARF